MFARAKNPFVELVEQATSENLTEPNWDLNVRVCDELGRVENGAASAKDCAAVLLRKITQKNPTVTKHAVILASACVKNCGYIFHQEVANKAFMNALIKHINDKTVHETARACILSFIEECVEEFRNKPALNNVEIEYRNLLRQGVVFPPKQQPNNSAEEAKRKAQAEAEQREREELELALALSISENESKKQQAKPVSRRRSSGNAASPAREPSKLQAAPLSAGRTAAEAPAAAPSYARALYDFTGADRGELPFRKGDLIEVVEQSHPDWWRGRIDGGPLGLFPANHVQLLPTAARPSVSNVPASSGGDAAPTLAALEAAINPEPLERLLHILSTVDPHRTNVADNVEVQDLVAASYAMKAKLTELLVELNRRQDEYRGLNDLFIQARATYDRLLAAAVGARRTAAGPAAVPPGSAVPAGGAGPYGPPPADQPSSAPWAGPAYDPYWSPAAAPAGPPSAPVPTSGGAYYSAPPSAQPPPGAPGAAWEPAAGPAGPAPAPGAGPSGPVYEPYRGAPPPPPPPGTGTYAPAAPYEAYQQAPPAAGPYQANAPSAPTAPAWPAPASNGYYGSSPQSSGAPPPAASYAPAQHLAPPPGQGGGAPNGWAPPQGGPYQPDYGAAPPPPKPHGTAEVSCSGTKA